MPIPFTCSHCGHKTNVADQYAGHTRPCPSCGKAITVPSVSGARPVHFPPGRSSQRTNHMKKLGWIGLGVAVVVLLFVIMIVGADEPPLSIVTRDSFVGAGKVLIITNTSDDYLHACTIKIEAPNGQVFGPKVFATTLEPHAGIEVGWMELEGWVVEPGERVTVSCRGFGNLTVYVSQ